MLYPLLHGTLAYTGLQVLEPLIAYAADPADVPRRADYLEALRERLSDA